MGGRRPAPPEQTLFMAERNAWREVHELMHSGMFLKEALEKMKSKEKAKGRRARTKRGNGGPPFARHSGTRRAKDTVTRVEKGKARPRINLLIGLPIGRSKTPKVFPFVGTISSKNNVRASVAGLTIAQPGSVGHTFQGSLPTAAYGAVMGEGPRRKRPKRCNPAVSPSGKPAVGGRSPPKPNLKYQGTCLTFWDSVKPILG